MKAPTVVVITPAYNPGPYLQETLACVQAQTYPNLVHFVLDNASTDATQATLANFAADRVPLKVHRNDTLLPIAENWNKAYELGVGDADYFRFLCADDTMSPDSIEKMVALAESDRDVTVVASQRKFDDWVETFNWDRSRQVFPGREALRSCFLGDTGLAPPHFLYRSSHAASRTPFFDESILSFDTEAGFFLLAREGAKLGFVHEPLGYTRCHDSSVTALEVNAKRTDYFDWHVLVERFGSFALSPEELRDYKQAFRRHYLGRMLAWRWRYNAVVAADWHHEALRSVDAAPRVGEYIDAVLDYCLRKLNYRPGWDRYPQG